MYVPIKFFMFYIQHHGTNIFFLYLYMLTTFCMYSTYNNIIICLFYHNNNNLYMKNNGYSIFLFYMKHFFCVCVKFSLKSIIFTF